MKVRAGNRRGKHFVVTEHGFLEKDVKGLLHPLGDKARAKLKEQQKKK